MVLNYPVRYAAMRKLNDFIKRARMAKIHAFIISSLKGDMPKLFGKGRKKKELIKNLPVLLKGIQEDHLVANSDLPELSKLQEKLNQADFEKFPVMKDKLVAQVNHMLDVDISELMGIVPAGDSEPVIRGGAFDDVKDQISPFGYEKCEGKSCCVGGNIYSCVTGIDLGHGEPGWVVTKVRPPWYLMISFAVVLYGSVC